MNYTPINEVHLKQNRPLICYIAITSTIIAVAGFLHNDLVYSVTNILFSVIGLFFDPLIPLCISIATAPLSLETSSYIAIGLKGVITFPALYVYIRGKSGGIRKDDFLLIFSATLLILLSFLFGTEARLITAILQIMTIMCYVVSTRTYRNNHTDLIFISFLLSGLLMAFAVTIQITTGSAVTLWGTRLTYNGSVRTLSSALAFPIFVTLSHLFLPREKKFGAWKFSLIIITLIAMVSLLIATYSRGVIISIVVASAYVLLSQFHHLKLKQMIIYIIMFIIAAIAVLNAELDTGMMFHGISDGSGRTYIWRFFFEKIREKGLLGYLFGFGPGDILRISKGTVYDGYYSHSVLLDYIFSYGLVGLSVLTFFLFRSLRVVIRSKNPLHMGLLILTVMLYATHGNSASMEFHLLLGLVYSLAMSQIQKTKRITEMMQDV